MATTLIPECPPLKNDVDLEEVLRDTYQAYSESMGDVDKASDIESHEYHAGAADAYRATILSLTGKDMI